VSLFLNSYLAAEENEIMKKDHKQLEGLKNEFNK
jgi:hypothetical protein